MKTWTVYTVTSDGEWSDPRVCERWEEAVEVITARCINGGVIAVAVAYY